jgi:hypothetical protein
MRGIVHNALYVCKIVDLMLSTLPVTTMKVVAIQGGSGTGNGAPWALGGVPFVAADPVLWLHPRSNHFQRVELGGYLENSTCRLRRAKQGADISHDVTELTAGRRLVEAALLPNRGRDDATVFERVRAPTVGSRHSRGQLQQRSQLAHTWRFERTHVEHAAVHGGQSGGCLLTREDKPGPAAPRNTPDNVVVLV